jgi:hypothetical protein
MLQELKYIVLTFAYRDYLPYFMGGIGFETLPGETGHPDNASLPLFFMASTEIYLKISNVSSVRKISAAADSVLLNELKNRRLHTGFLFS